MVSFALEHVIKSEQVMGYGNSIIFRSIFQALHRLVLCRKDSSGTELSTTLARDNMKNHLCVIDNDF